MQTPTDQLIERYLYSLAYAHNWERLKSDFQDNAHTQEPVFVEMQNVLIGAYFAWHEDRNALQALIFLEDATDICNERLYTPYLFMYNTSIAFLKECTSRAGTPIHDQDAHIQNLLQRMMLVLSGEVTYG